MKCLNLICLVLILAGFCQRETDGARILGVFSPPAPSHYILGSRLMKELAARGHEVTMIASYKQKSPVKNFKEVYLSGLVEEMEQFKNFVTKISQSTFMSQFNQVLTMGQKMTEDTLSHPEVQKLLNSNEKFDLIILESFLSEATMGFAYYYNTPVVILSTIGANIWVNEYTKNPAPSSYVPQIISSYSNEMTFTERLKNFLLSIYMDAVYRFLHLPSQNKILHQYFPDAPPLTQIMTNMTSIVLLNSHSSISISKPIVPNMIEIGGYHVEEPKELPKDLKHYLDNAKEGFILFSMGSNFKSIMFPIEIKDMILKVFSKLQYKVLWKFENETLPGKPDNVKISAWLPQNDILAHPNLKLFITHGGLLSTTEATYHGVPIVGVPVFGDQSMNMAQCERLGMGKTVPYLSLTYESLYSAVQEVLSNRKYHENARERSKIMRDQPLRPIDNAVFWVEYALRHKYATHFKTGAVNLEWYQIQLLDVLAVLIGGFITVLFIIRLILRKIFCRSKQKKQLKDKKKKQ